MLVSHAHGLVHGVRNGPSGTETNTCHRPQFLNLTTFTSRHTTFGLTVSTTQVPFTNAARGGLSHGQRVPSRLIPFLFCVCWLLLHLVVRPMWDLAHAADLHNLASTVSPEFLATDDSLFLLRLAV